MIPVDEVPDVAVEDRGGRFVELESLALDDADLAAFDYLDAQLDAQASVLRGEMFTASVPSQVASERVLGAVKQAWEIGGWIVGVFSVSGGHQLVIARSRGGVSVPKKTAEALRARDEARVETQRGVAPAPARESRTREPLLVRMPTRGRPEQALRVLERYRRMASARVAIEVVIDEDDESMNCAQVLQRLGDLDCVVTAGRHRSKIEAVNGGRVDNWGILLLASDDMWPVVEGYDRRIVEEMGAHFPLLDGALNFNDGFNRDHARAGKPVLCTLPVIGRHLYDQFGAVYHHGYGSLYCDDEYTEVLTKMRRLAFIDEVIVEHRHHAAGKTHNDALYQHNDSKWGASDRALFEAREAEGFYAPPMVLSVLICTVPERAGMLARLVSWLRWQAREFPRQVEICVDDRVGVTVGEKRQALLERAVGEYVAHVDDDDMVSSDYVRRVVGAANSQAPAAPDCLSLVGEMTTDGGRSERFEHSIRFDGWYTRDGIHYRTPNHLSAVRRDLALQVGFVAENVGEDHDFSRRLRPLLAAEASTGPAPLYYYFFRPQHSVQRGSK